MKVTLNNYEELLLDHSEGKLSAEMQQELRTFLAMHPDLGISLDDLDLPVLEQEDTSGDLGTLLLKFQTPAEEEICKYLEGEMSSAEINAFEARVKSDPVLRAELTAFRKTVLHPETVGYEHKELLRRDLDPILENKAIQYVEGLLSHADSAHVAATPELQQEVKLFQLTKLVPDAEVFFENKKVLKRSARIIPLFTTRTIAAAAALFLLASLSVIYIIFSEKDTVPIAVKKEITKDKATRAKTIPVEKINESDKTVAVQTSSVHRSLFRKPTNTPIKEEEEKFTVIQARDSVYKVPEIEPAPLLATETKKVEPDNETLKSAVPDTSSNKRTSVAFNDLPLVEDDLVYAEEQDTRVSFWQRVTRIAGEANRLGVKAVDGEVLRNEGFRLSINSISIEKK